MLFREYSSSDQTSLIQLFNEFQDYIVSIDPIHRVRRLPNYGKAYLSKTLDKISQDRGKFIVVESDNQIIGFTVGIVKVRSGDDLLEGFPSTYSEVIELYVCEKFRSQNVGSQLMNKIETYFAEQHCDAIFIEVFAPNVKARSFYEKHGYGMRDVFLLKELPGSIAPSAK